jgi:hypothetical protein
VGRRFGIPRPAFQERGLCRRKPLSPTSRSGTACPLFLLSRCNPSGQSCADPETIVISPVQGPFRQLTPLRCVTLRSHGMRPDPLQLPLSPPCRGVLATGLGWHGPCTCKPLQPNAMSLSAMAPGHEVSGLCLDSRPEHHLARVWLEVPSGEGVTGSPDGLRGALAGEGGWDPPKRPLQGLVPSNWEWPPPAASEPTSCPSENGSWSQMMAR